jgi:hypothetical protein
LLTDSYYYYYYETFLSSMCSTRSLSANGRYAGNNDVHAIASANKPLTRLSRDMGQGTSDDDIRARASATALHKGSLLYAKLCCRLVRSFQSLPAVLETGSMVSTM